MNFKLLLIPLLFSTSLVAQSKKPISLHPGNPHYFLFRDKPAILITSAEHYGAVVNTDFDFITYLDELKANGLNYTRIFSGAYIEVPGDFNISKNTLAPKAGSFICPWARSREPGYKNGGNKFDLGKWDEKYFERLKSFVSEAGKRDIVVEMTLFTSLYSDKGWENSPMNGINNINKINTAVRNDAHTLNNGNLLKYQEAMVGKIVAGLKGFDNVFFEIQNEPWADFGVKVLNLERKDENLGSWQKVVEEANPASLKWQQHILSIIKKEEADLKEKHLIAQNYANFIYQLKDVNPDVSILNFHYAFPEAVTENYRLNKVIGFDESGFAGNKDETYRRQAWRFIMAGGGLFNNLDYSFTIQKPDGTDQQEAPGGGSRTLRKQLKILKNFMESFDFVQMKPETFNVPDNKKYTAYQLSDTGKQYAFYFEGLGQEAVSLNLPAGNYTLEMISVLDGSTKPLVKKKHKGGELKLDLIDQDDFALRVVRQ